MGGVFAATCIKLVLQLLSFDFVIWGTPNENVVSHPDVLKFDLGGGLLLLFIAIK